MFFQIFFLFLQTKKKSMTIKNQKISVDNNGFKKSNITLNGNEIDLVSNAEHGKKAMWQKSSGIFRKELIDANIFDTYSAIAKGYRTMTSRGEVIIDKIKPADVVTVSSYNYQRKLVIIILNVSQKTVGEMINENPLYLDYWSSKQGWTTEYVKVNPYVLEKYDIEFICLGEEK